MTDVDNEIVFGEPVGIGLDERRGGDLKALANDAGGMGGEVDLPGPAAGESDESLPGTGEGKLEDGADDTIVVVFNLAEEALAGFEDERLGRLNHRRTLVADIARSGMFECGLLDGRSTQEVAEAVKTNLFRDVKLKQNMDGPGEKNRFPCGFSKFRHPVKDSTV